MVYYLSIFILFSFYIETVKYFFFFLNDVIYQIGTIIDTLFFKIEEKNTQKDAAGIKNAAFFSNRTAWRNYND